MNGWIILAITLGGYLLCYRVAYQFLDEHEGADSDDAMDRAFPAIMALLIAMVWPLVLAWWVIWRFATPKTARQRRAELRELEQRRDEVQHDIARMERQLGIRKEQS
jgi:hypothetical protein